jgi:HlyD family secretion protein
MLIVCSLEVNFWKNVIWNKARESKFGILNKKSNRRRFKLKKKRILISGILIVVLGAGFLAYRATTNARASDASSVQTTTVQRGSLESTLSSSGNTRANQSATVTWQTSGKVSEVALQVGDTIQVDQVLAALDSTSLPTDMMTAKQTLLDAQQALEDLLDSKTQQAEALEAVEEAQQSLATVKQTAAADRSQAQQTLADAQAALEDAQSTRDKMNYPHSTDKLVIEQAQTQYLLAKADYKDALKAYNAVDQKKLTNPDRVQALNRLVTAEANLKTKLATYNWYMLGYTDTEVAQADAALAVAQANLDKAQADWDLVKDNDSSAAVMLAEAKLADAQRAYERVKDGPSQAEVDAAQAAVDAAQATVDRIQVRAPFTGTITEVDAKTGDLVSSGDTAFRIDDLSSIYVDLEISEVDVASLKVGQKATLEFDAIADKTYSGEVTDISLVGSVSQGVVNYPVTVRITDADANIRPGMTASVAIPVDQVDNALIVPNKAIHTSNGQRTVTVLSGDQQISVPVTVILTGDSQSAVTSPQLKEGDVVVISGSTATTTTSSSQSSNNAAGNLGGLSGPPSGSGGPPPGMP